MATANVAPLLAQYAGPLGTLPNSSLGLSAPPRGLPTYRADSVAFGQPLHEAIAPYPPNAGPAAGASAVIDAENDGLLSVAAVSALVAGIAALLIPVLFELFGARISHRLGKYLTGIEAKNSDAKGHGPSGVVRLLDTADQSYRGRLEQALSEVDDAPLQATLAKLASDAKLTTGEVYGLRRATLLMLLEEIAPRGEAELERFLQRQHELLERLGPGDLATGKLEGRVLEAEHADAAAYADRRRTVRGVELHAHHRLLTFLDETASFASSFSRFGRVRSGRKLYAAATSRSEVERPRTAGEVEAFYKRLGDRPQPWLRAIHTTEYIDQQWPGLLQDVATPQTSAHDRFEVWIEHPIPKKRILTDLPQPDSATRPVAVFAHRSENDAALRLANYSLGRELDVAYGNYGAFKAGATDAKLRQIAHRYALNFCGAKDTMADPRGMGKIFANLAVMSITLSALLYGSLYLVEYLKIKDDLQKANLPTGSGTGP